MRYPRDLFDMGCKPTSFCDRCGGLGHISEPGKSCSELFKSSRLSSGCPFPPFELPSRRTFTWRKEHIVRVRAHMAANAGGEQSKGKGGGKRGRDPTGPGDEEFDERFGINK